MHIKKGLGCGGRGESEKSPALSYASIVAIPIISKRVRQFQLKIITKNKKT
jgi:hypothetical protein